MLRRVALPFGLALIALVFHAPAWGVPQSTNTVEYAPIAGPSGALGSWVASPPLNIRRGMTALVAYDDRLYAVGGEYSFFTDPAYASIERSSIAPDGSLSSWSVESNQMLQALTGVGGVAHNGYLYAIGGSPAFGQTTGMTQYAAILPDGSLGPWAATSSLAVPTCEMGVAVWNGYVYVLGGVNGYSRLTTVQRAAFNPDGTLGTFVTLPPLPQDRWAPAVVATGGYLYVLGRAGIEDRTVLSAAINPDGSLGSWNSQGNTQDLHISGCVAVWDGYLYAIGTPTHDRVEKAQLLGGGLLGPWEFTSPRLVPGLDWPATAAWNGKLYRVGGTCTDCASGPPSVPPGVAASQNTPGVTVSWSDVGGETGYRLRRDGSLIASPPPNATSYFDAIGVGTYQYCVSAYNSSGESSQSCATGTSTGTVGPPNVTGCSASQGGLGVDVTWTDVANEAGYVVTRNSVTIATLPAGSTHHHDSVPFGTYTYCVAAFNGSGTGSSCCAIGTSSLVSVGPEGSVAGIERRDRLTEGFKLVTAQPSAPPRVTSAPRGQSHGPGDPDTVWVGHSGGAVALANYWGVASGGRWTWETPPHGDTLQGWWPIRRTYNLTGGLVLSDEDRSWWALDYGNQANYVINQGAGHRRTFGVTGVWHRDPGAAAGVGVGWSPLQGDYSAWCGLRAHGDVTVMDPITGNPLNQSVLQFNGENGSGASGTSKNFPGYGKQWDQMLYRDIVVPGGTTSLGIRFRLTARMSRGRNLDPATRTGWFDKDPLAVTPGNFISSTVAGTAGAPTDSCMVYLGVPVDDENCVYSDGFTRAVADPVRRWFAEVLRVHEPGVPYHELLSVSGNVPENPSEPAPTYYYTIPPQYLAPLLGNATGNRLRLVFRVKTNSTYDDQDAGESGYSSMARGAATIDVVEVEFDPGNFTMLGDFESPSSIDNLPSTPATSAWKSTGKPPAIFFHPHQAYELEYSDMCGAIDSPGRVCNLGGTVISAGDHDQGEAAGWYGAERERMDGMVSPTVNLVSDGPGLYNAMGIDSEIADATDDYFVAYEIYTGIANTAALGNAWTYAFQSYPAQQPNGLPAWGELRFPRFQLFNPNSECFQDLEPARQYGLIRTSNASGIPDSIRVFLGKIQQCFRFGVTTACSPTEGLYFDNVAIGFVDDPEEPQLSRRSVTVQPWHWFGDCFPANSTTGVPGTAAFDTCAALIKTGLNIAAQRGTTSRSNVPGDSVVVEAYGPDTRVDLVFRISPGPGNYVSHGERASGLRRVPTSSTPVTVGDMTNFWSSYMANNGAFGTYGNGFSGPGHGPQWNPDVWNSARCDTAEINLFPVSARGNLTGLEAGVYCATHHESDPKFTNLGILRPRCFLSDTLGPANTTNIVCGQVPAWALFIPGKGFDGEPLTREFTKIIPDGQLTPGSHVEYFFRRSRASDPMVFAMVPDTQRVFPQKAEGSWDGHRWQQFNVLPDRWKAAVYGGFGEASMLVVDWGDRRGDERAWVSIADSIGATHSSKFGAGTGWHAAGDVNYEGVAVASDPSIAVYPNLGQPGTAWDLFNVRAGESLITTAGALGSRLAAYGGPGYMQGKESSQGPTPEMLRDYYRTILLLSGDLSSQILGPYPDRGDDDVTLLQDHLSNGEPGSRRGLHVMGTGFAQSMEDGSGPTQSAFMQNRLGASLRNWSYMNSSANTDPLIYVTCVPPLDPVPLFVENRCWGNNLDELNVNGAVQGAHSVAQYPNVGWNGPYHGSVLTESPFGYISQLDGWSISALPASYIIPGPSHPGAAGARRDSLLSGTYWNRVRYIANVYARSFGEIVEFDSPGVLGVDPPDPGSRVPFRRFVQLASANPARTGSVRVRFGLEAAGHVRVSIHDVAGRRVSQLADRDFAAGVFHDLTWDGRDAGGGPARPGIYFLSFASPGYQVTRRVVMLR